MKYSLKKKESTITVVFVILFCLLIFSCNSSVVLKVKIKSLSSPTPAPVTTVVPTEVNIAAPSTTIQISETGNDTLQLTATVKLSDGKTNSEVNWESSNSSIATVDNSGLVTATKDGLVKITAKSKQDTNIKDSIDITIAPKPEPTPTTLPKELEIDLIID